MARAQRFARLLKTVEEIAQRPGQSPAQLARRMKVSERSLSRDVHDLRRLGVNVSFEDGYQIQERLDLDAPAGLHETLPAVYDRQMKMLRTEVGPKVALRVESDLASRAPVALASLIAGSLERVGRAGSRT